MHLPDHYLSPEVAGISTAAAVGALAWGAVQFRKLPVPHSTTFAATTAGIFAAQMINFPVAEGTSGHLIGGAIAALILGPWEAMLAMTVVLVVQCLVFADGGVAVLGANVLNMAVIAPLVAYGVYNATICGSSNLARRAVAAATAGWLSVMAAALACSVQLGLSGTHPLGATLAAMLSIHAAIGLAEACITAAVMVAVWRFSTRNAARAVSESAVEKSRQRGITLPILFCLIIALLLSSPFASSAPDGLEKVGEQLQFAAVGNEIAIASPLPDYAWPSVQVEFLSTVLAGLVGVLICGFSVVITLRVMNASRRA